MLGQKGSWLGVWNFHDGSRSHSVTVQVHNEDIFAEIAIIRLAVNDEETHNSHVYISQIVSDRGVENFDFLSGKPLAFRTNVTSITFTVDVMYCYTRARWMINIWS